MIAVTLVEDIGIGAASVLALAFAFAAWRGIKVIIVRKNGTD